MLSAVSVSAQVNTSRDWKDKASSYFASESYDLALESINKALDLDPNNKEALLLKGLIQFNLHKYNDSILAFEKVLSLDNKDKNAWKGKGLAYLRLGKYNEAINCFDEALKIDPMDAEASYYKAQALDKTGKKEEAAKFRERAISLEPSYAYKSGSEGRELKANWPGTGLAYGQKPIITMEIDNPDFPWGFGIEPIQAVLPGQSITFTANITNLGQKAFTGRNSPYPSGTADPAGRDWARDVTIHLDLTEGVKVISPLPDVGTSNQWTTEIRGDTFKLFNITVMLPNVNNVYVAPFIDFYGFWFEPNGRKLNTVSLFKNNIISPNLESYVYPSLLYYKIGLWPPVYLLAGIPQVGLTKSASSEAAAPGEIVTYTLDYQNLGGKGFDLLNIPKDFDPDQPDLDFPNNWTRDITVTESYPTGTTFISASPSPDKGTSNKWTFENVTKGGGGKINITLKMPEPRRSDNIKFDYDQTVSGSGFMRSSKDLTTEIPPPLIVTNTATASIFGLEVKTASKSVIIKGNPGTSLAERKSGSGDYNTEEITRYNRINNSIMEISNLSTTYKPTVFSLQNGRSIDYGSKWSKATSARNYITDESLEEAYLYANYIRRESALRLGENVTSLAVEGSFEGMRHLGYLKEANDTSNGHSSPIMELSQDYVGSFKVHEVIESKTSNKTNIAVGTQRYDEPHITVYQYGEPVGDGAQKTKYTAIILNDGNRSLGPVYVKDEFPVGAYFSQASIDPASYENNQANWMFTHLPIGSSVTIDIEFTIDTIPDQLINCVYVTAGYEQHQINAFNCTAARINWLSCCI